MTLGGPFLYYRIEQCSKNNRFKREAYSMKPHKTIAHTNKSQKAIQSFVEHTTKSQKTKENIINNAINLIQQNNGDVDKITIRKIAEAGGIGVGLINHYFGSKDKLIEVCIQRIISSVIYSFTPNSTENDGMLARTKTCVKQVMDFLMENQAISRISILGDLKHPEALDNTMKTVMGLSNTISNGAPTQQSKILSFLLTSIMQEVFLRKDVLKESIGIDLYNKAQRDNFLEGVVDSVCGRFIGGSIVDSNT